MRCVPYHAPFHTGIFSFSGPGNQQIHAQPWERSRILAFLLITAHLAITAFEKRRKAQLPPGPEPSLRSGAGGGGGGDQGRGSYGDDVRLTGGVLRVPGVEADDASGLLPGVQAHHDGVGSDVPVDTLRAGRGGE